MDVNDSLSIGCVGPLGIFGLLASILGGIFIFGIVTGTPEIVGLNMAPTEPLLGNIPGIEVSIAGVAAALGTVAILVDNGLHKKLSEVQGLEAFASALVVIVAFGAIFNPGLQSFMTSSAVSSVGTFVVYTVGQYLFAWLF